VGDDGYFLTGREDSEPVPIPDLATLDAVLDAWHRDHRESGLLAMIKTPHGDCLGIGLGRERSVLGWIPADQSASAVVGNLVSSGEIAEQDPLISYLFEGHFCEYSLRETVPMALARAAVTYFFIHGLLPPMIRWREL